MSLEKEIFFQNGNTRGGNQTLGFEVIVRCLIHYSMRMTCRSMPTNNFIFKFPKFQIESRSFTGLLEQNSKIIIDQHASKIM